MRQTVAISLPADLKKELDKVCRDEGVSRSELVRKCLRDCLFTRRFRILRASMLAKARAQRIHTDQDVFDQVS
jgi:metal-responsive CopG/Arc/MetJ family transcriptional regulator